MDDSGVWPFYDQFSYLVSARMTIFAVVLIYDYRVVDWVQSNVFKCDIFRITRSTLHCASNPQIGQRNNFCWWINYQIILCFLPIFHILITCHVLILAPFVVPLRIDWPTYTCSTVSWALSCPKLPMLQYQCSDT